jgi:serine/threonine protein kinase
MNDADATLPVVPPTPAGSGGGTLQDSTAERLLRLAEPPRRLWQPPAIAIIQRLLPQYEISALLGRGGMGAVYKGVQKSLDRAVAIKILPPEVQHGDPSFAERFKRESKAMAKLGHPNIVPVYDAGETADGLLYYVMEFIQGTDLAHIMRTEHVLPPKKAGAIISQVCDALEFAHKHGIIHRDIKPSNVIVDEHGRVLVADFGLAKTLHGDAQADNAMTLTGLAMGTPLYMAPEQAIGRAVDHRADIYSLGALFYEMLTGAPPQGALRPPSSSLDLDQRLDGVVLKALATDPAQRYQRVSEVKSAVSDIMAHPMSLPRKSNGPWLALAGTALLAAGAWITRERWGDPGKSPVSPPLAAKPARLPPNAPAPPSAVAPFSPLAARQHQDRWSEHLGIPVTSTSTIGMKLALIPPGEFEMGADGAANLNEKPRHTVVITRPFLMGVHEVTQREYELVMGVNPAADIPKFSGPQLPANTLQWEEAAKFCEKLSAREQRKFRLPTEAEWEYACRAGSASTWSYGNAVEVVGDYAWTDENSNAMAHPVGEKLPNPFGLYDMHGNVWEFCSDWFGNYTAGKQTDPQGPPTGPFRAYRGGSWFFPWRESHSSNRPDKKFPAFGTNLGFRIVCEIE